MFFSRLRALAGIAALLLTAGFLHYSLPSRDVVRIVRTDVVRQDVDRRCAQGHVVPADPPARVICAHPPLRAPRAVREPAAWSSRCLVTVGVLGGLIVRRGLTVLFRRNVGPVIEELDREFDQRAGAVARRYRQARRWVRQRFGV